MTKEETIALLKGLGFPTAHIKTIEDNWDKTDFKIDSTLQTAMLNDFTTDQRTMFIEDSEVYTAVDKKVKGRYLDIAEREVKKVFALTSDETKDKDFNGIVQIAKTKATANSNKTVEELQDKLLTAETENKRLKEEEIPNIQKTVENDRRAIKVETAFEKMANDLATELTTKNPKALRVPFPTLLKNAKLILAEQYNFELDEKDDTALVVKDKQGLKIKAATGTAFLTPKDAVLNVWKENQFIAESNAPDDPSKKPVLPKHGGGGPDNPNPDGDDDALLKKYPHLAKAKAHAESLKTTPEKT